MSVDYTPVNPRIYTLDELKSSIETLKQLHEMCVRGDIDQHASPGLLVAIDCVAKEIDSRDR